MFTAGSLLTCSLMKIIIENAETFKFFAGEGQWTSNATEGKPFASTTQAFSVARHEPVGKFNITGYIDETGQLVNLRSGRGTASASVPSH
jgi:hypothetical protein